MTRVNLVKPKKLYDQHLMAEYREIPMVIASLKRSMRSVNGDKSKLKIPSEFTLNKGHVSFFYDKGKWLHDRFNLCVNELKARGFKLDVESRSIDWDYFKQSGLWETDWKPTKQEKKLSKERIRQRVSERSGWYRKTERLK